MPADAISNTREPNGPGGLVAVRDSDYLGFTWFPETPAFDEWMRLYQEAALANGGEPQAGRRLLSWARAAGFNDMLQHLRSERCCDDRLNSPSLCGVRRDRVAIASTALGNGHRVTCETGRRGLGLASRIGYPTRNTTSGCDPARSNWAKRAANVAGAPVARSRSMRSVIWFMCCRARPRWVAPRWMRCSSRPPSSCVAGS